MKLTIFVILLGFVMVFTGFSFGSGEKVPKEEGSMEDAMEMSAEESDGSMASGGIVEFTTLEDARMAATEGPAVLFFRAGWCPTCKSATAEIDARLAELGEITVIVVDYDTEKELKAMYGVTYQHTFVLIDGDGEAISSWNGGGVDAILDNVTKMEKG